MTARHVRVSLFSFVTNLNDGIVNIETFQKIIYWNFASYDGFSHHVDYLSRVVFNIRVKSSRKSCVSSISLLAIDLDTARDQPPPTLLLLITDTFIVYIVFLYYNVLGGEKLVQNRGFTYNETLSITEGIF